jgi:hypothetical protein
LIVLLVIAVVGVGSELLMRYTRADEGHSLTAAGARAHAPPRAEAAADTAAPCRVLASGVELPANLHEASGAAWSRRTPGLLWTHDDSGQPVLFGVDSGGGERARVRVTGATNVNWEDIAQAACPAGGSCLYVGDIGDNQARRPGITVYRVPEPDAGAAATAPAEAFGATYPDGPQDAEAMFVLPGSALYVATKGETGPAGLYRFPQPLRPGSSVVLEKVASISNAVLKRHERITGGSASADGQWTALRTLRSVSFYRTQGGAVRTLAEPRVMDLSPLNEAQGEGVGFGDGGAVFLTSEGGNGKKHHATMARLSCTLPG